MSRLSKIYFVLTLLTIADQLSATEPISSGTDTDDKSASQRLNRRKRSWTAEEEFLELLRELKDDKLTAAEENEIIIQLLKSYPMAIVSDSDDYLGPRAHTPKPQNWDEDRVKAPPFSPRLGRRSQTQHMKPRLGRSGTSENIVFKPRLGRADYFVDEQH